MAAHTVAGVKDTTRVSKDTENRINVWLPWEYKYRGALVEEGQFFYGTDHI